MYIFDVFEKLILICTHMNLYGLPIYLCDVLLCDKYDLYMDICMCESSLA